MRISDWSSDVCSSDLTVRTAAGYAAGVAPGGGGGTGGHGAVARPLFCVRSRRVVVTTTGQAAAPPRHTVPPGSVVDVPVALRFNIVAGDFAGITYDVRHKVGMPHVEAPQVERNYVAVN